jgi:hypothetical protein
MHFLIFLVFIFSYAPSVAAFPSAAAFLSSRSDEMIVSATGITRFEFELICSKYGGPGTPLTPFVFMLLFVQLALSLMSGSIWLALFICFPIENDCN